MQCIIELSTTCFYYYKKHPNSDNKFDHVLHAFNSSFMTVSLYLRKIQIWRNLNVHCYYLISTKSVIWQIDANCSSLQSLNMPLFGIMPERLKLIYYQIYYFKIGIICPLFLSSHVFSGLECGSNHFGILIWKIVKPRDYNEIKLAIGKIFRKCIPISHYFVKSQK